MVRLPELHSPPYSENAVRILYINADERKNTISKIILTGLNLQPERKCQMKKHKNIPPESSAPTDEPYRRLANAIIILAAKDYRSVLKKLKKYAGMKEMNPNRNIPGEKETLAEKPSIERFFRSGWFGTLSSVNPEIIIHRLQKEVGWK